MNVLTTGRITLAIFLQPNFMNQTLFYYFTCPHSLSYMRDYMTLDTVFAGYSFNEYHGMSSGFQQASKFMMRPVDQNSIFLSYDKSFFGCPVRFQICTLVRSDCKSATDPGMPIKEPTCRKTTFTSNAQFLGNIQLLLLNLEWQF